MMFAGALLALFAATSPLGGPEDYVFAPFGAGTNTAPFVKGEVEWPLPGIRAIRAEDLAFIDEAFAERYGFLESGFSNTVNAIGYLRFAPYGSVAFAGLRRLRVPGVEADFTLPVYGDPGQPLESRALYWPPVGETFTGQVSIAVGIETNITWQSVTNYWTIPNAYREDWPGITVVSNVVRVAVTNIAPVYVVTNYTRPKNLVDYICKSPDGGCYVMVSNVFAGVDYSIDAIPRVADMTNLYALAARCSRAVLPATGVYPGKYERTEDFDYSYVLYDWNTNGNSWTERVLATNGTRTVMGAFDPGRSTWRATYEKSRVSHTEFVDGKPVVSYSPDQLLKEEYTQYNPTADPVEFRLDIQHDVAQGRVDSAKLYVQYRITATHNVYDFSASAPTNIYSFETNIYPVKIYDVTPKAKSNEVLVVSGPLGEVELGQEYARPLIAPTGYPELFQSRHLTINTAVQQAIAVVTPTFTTAAEESSPTGE